MCDENRRLFHLTPVFTRFYCPDVFISVHFRCDCTYMAIVWNGYLKTHKMFTESLFGETEKLHVFRFDLQSFLWSSFERLLLLFIFLTFRYRKTWGRDWQRYWLCVPRETLTAVKVNWINLGKNVHLPKVSLAVLFHAFDIICAVKHFYKSEIN